MPRVHCSVFFLYEGNSTNPSKSNFAIKNMYELQFSRKWIKDKDWWYMYVTSFVTGFDVGIVKGNIHILGVWKDTMLFFIYP